MLESISKKRLAGIAIIAALFAFSCVAPFYANEMLTSRTQAFLMGLGVFALFIILAVPIDRKLAQSNISIKQAPFNNPKSVFLACFIILELVFLFALLSNFPGYCSPDSNDLVKEVLGQPTRSEWFRYDGLSNHHPVFYTFCLWIVFILTSPLNDVMLSIAVFLFIQMSYLAFAISIAVVWIDRTGAPKAFTVVVIAFFALSPIVCTHAITLWKDIPFCATILLLLVLLAQLNLSQKLDIKRAIQLLLILLLIMLFRNNGIFVSMAVLIYLIVFYGPARKACCAIAAGIAVSFALLNGPIFSLLSIQPGHFAESVGIPIQQVAATIKTDADISEEDQEVLENILPLEKWSATYISTTPNKIKFYPEFNDDYLDSHKAEFLKVWFHLLPGNLSTYIKAWVQETYSYWQPGFTTLVGCPDTLNGGRPRDIPGAGFNPYLIANLIHPNFPILFGSGALIWLTSLFLYLSLIMRKGQRRASILLPFIPLFALFATILIAAPTLYDYRYVFALFLAIPFLCHLALTHKMKSNQQPHSFT